MASEEFDEFDDRMILPELTFGGYRWNPGRQAFTCSVLTEFTKEEVPVLIARAKRRMIRMTPDEWRDWAKKQPPPNYSKWPMAPADE